MFEEVGMITCTIFLNILGNSKDDDSLYQIIIKIIGWECSVALLSGNHGASTTISASIRLPTPFITGNIIMYLSARAKLNGLLAALPKILIVTPNTSLFLDSTKMATFLHLPSS